MNKVLHVGMDIGSTTIKLVCLNENKEIIDSSYERHYSDTKNVVYKALSQLTDKYSDYDFTITLTGSGAMFVSKALKLPFIQEVISCKRVVERNMPETDVVIELGGEDAKIVYFDKSIEQRMNGTCAGGTGAFLDQMALLLNTDTMGLNELAKGYKLIYPIASRCGVFAKSDIQPLLNEGAAKEDIAVSVFQAVVNQTISGLACGRPIRGNIAFLGGPLNYLPELKKRFIETLKLPENQVVAVKDAHLLVAEGAALDSINYSVISAEKLRSRLDMLNQIHDDITEPLAPLFRGKEDYEAFKERHSKNEIKKGELNGYKGSCFLGIDAGSTTSKLVLTDKDGKLIYSLYKSNEGKPLQSVMDMLKEMYKALPAKAVIKYAGVTGYGEKLIQSALNIEVNEIETIAHYTAAKVFMPNVTSIVDIGGQDMKYIRIKDGAINNIMLNEACSSGCGSFLETFAKSLNLTMEEFVESALKSRRPVDLGSRCTVFMNSKIKQAQKEGYAIGDISAGLSYSIIKNAIQKVMKIRDVSTLGDNIVVQGGTFYNDAVLRAFEIITGKEVIRPDIAGLMGAYGVAYLAKEKYKELKVKKEKSSILGIKELESLKVDIDYARCGGCENRCMLTINKFSNGQKFISGNRCERGSGKTVVKNDLPNLYKYKNERIFGYEPLDEKEAKRGTIGIPRVLNMYEDYPFWFTFLTNLGFRVVLSEKSSRKTYEKGMESMPSESVCYPAKLSHGHIMSLIEQGIKTIFYPCIPYSRKEFEKADNKYNCPIVISYPEVLRNNVEELKNVKFINSFLPFDTKNLVSVIMELPEFKEYNFTKHELTKAAKVAEEEYQKCKEDIREKGQEALSYMKKNKAKGIVLSGRPYHVDPEINHGIDTLITSLGLCVLSEDSISNLAEVKRPIRVVDQWVYHARLYAAANFVGKTENLELIQLNSFGCGVDAVTTDQVEEILSSYGKLYTLIKIDEVNNLGAIRIRIRSLLASMSKRENVPVKNEGNYEIDKKIFTEKMRKDYTILVPQMAPIHFTLLESLLQSEGYNVKLLRNCTMKTVETGLKYVNNDACYPSILTTGQMIEALDSGEYDLDKTALIMSQTGGGCRATNYIGFIRKALKDAGYSNIPVISFNIVGMEKNPGFKITFSLITKLMKAIIYADLLQKVRMKNRAYEVNKGETEALFDKWLERAKKLIVKSNIKQFKAGILQIVEDFEKIELDTSIVKPKVGVVGEVLIKYHPFGNNNIAEKLEEEGAEVILPDFMGFIKFIATHKITFNKLLNTDRGKAKIFKYAIKFMDKLENASRIAISKSKKDYMPTCNIWELEDKVKDILSIGNQTGEGWFLTAEMIEYIEHGIDNIVCVQPFACLPNHIVGKGVIKTIRSKFPEANIVPIDYDPGASETNQTNRIKLLMTVAKDKIKGKNSKEKAPKITSKEKELSEV